MAFIPLIVPPAAFVTARWFVFQKGRLLVHNESADVPRLADLAELGLAVQRNVFLGSLHGEPSFAVEAEADCPAPEGMAWEGLRGLFMRYDEAHIAAAGRAVRGGRLGSRPSASRRATPTVRHEHERGRECRSASWWPNPRIAPAMMALVKRDRQLLLARAARFPEGMFSALAGFVEAGESVEDTIIREVREEVGVEVGNLRYFGSQSWPFLIP
jgi:NAD+ diphosphatase